MILRRLNEANSRIREGRHEVTQPIRVHLVVGINHADDLGIRVGMLQRDVEREGLEALDLAAFTYLKRGPSLRQCSSTGRHMASSGVLLMSTTHSKSG